MLPACMSQRLLAQLTLPSWPGMLGRRGPSHSSGFAGGKNVSFKLSKPKGSMTGATLTLWPWGQPTWPDLQAGPGPHLLLHVQLCGSPAPLTHEAYPMAAVLL